ncbi:MAG: hypothetical protein FWF71_04995 [Actinomycetia bacterium]|nr:hypothetical protein [Actinomycetes bacterium]
MSNPSLSLLAPAKLNLALEVTGKVINGKHQLHSVFTTIDLYDRLTVSLIPEAPPAVLIDMSYAPELPTLELPVGENTVYRAVQAFERQAGTRLWGELRISVEKHIPSESGLGGSSSDAASILLALGRLYPQLAAPGVIERAAVSVGADVSFFLSGVSSNHGAPGCGQDRSDSPSPAVSKIAGQARNDRVLAADRAVQGGNERALGIYRHFPSGGCALMAGAGERLVRHLRQPPFDILLVKASKGVSTAAAYQEFDRHPEPAKPLEALVSLLADEHGNAPQATVELPPNSVTPDALAPLLSNNLAAAACRLAPEITAVIFRLSQQPGVLKAQLTGSGSVVFGLCVNRQAAINAARPFAAAGLWVRVVRTV